MAVNRFLDHLDVDVFAIRNCIAERVAISSALKCGLMAAGEVDLMPRLVGSIRVGYSGWACCAGNGWWLGLGLVYRQGFGVRQALAP